MAQYVTAGGQRVDVRFSGNGPAFSGASGKCNACHATTIGPLLSQREAVGELEAREWAYKHAVKCTRRPK